MFLMRFFVLGSISGKAMINKTDMTLAYSTLALNDNFTNSFTQ